MHSKAARTLQRYAIPAFVVSLYHLFRSHAILSPATRIQLSPRISFGRGTVVKPYVVVQSTGGVIRFGKRCALSSFSHFSTGEGDIIIGDCVRVAPNCTIVGGTKQIPGRNEKIMDQAELSPNGITIGDDVLIGAGVVILPGSEIGTGAVIGAGSIVKGKISAYAIAAGNPARIIGERE